MPKAGDRVIVEGNKVGQQRREGTLVETVGSLIKVRWTDGSESLFTPGAGSVRFEAGNGSGGAKPAPKAKAAAAAKATSKAKALARGKAVAQGAGPKARRR